MAVYDQYGRTDNITRLEDVLPYLAMEGVGPPQGTKHNRGVMSDAFNSLNEPWPGAIDQVATQNGVVRDKYTIVSNPPSEFSQAYVNTMGSPGANQGTGPKTADQAIADMLVQGGTPAVPLQFPRSRPFFPPTQMDEAIAIGKAYRPSQEVQAALAAPAPQEQRRAPVGGLLGLLLGGGERTGGGLMGLSGPERTNPNITYDQPLVHVPGTAGEVGGVDMAFMPQSVQQSSRWRTGY